MSDSNVRQHILDYLGEAKMMQLATSDGKSPWVCNVWFASDAHMSIYWISSTKRRHSEELSRNPRVAASICIPREPSESDKGALQIEGIATEVTSPAELAKALKLYVSRGFFTLAQVKKFMANLDHPHRFYKITPERIVYFGKGSEEYILK